MKKIYLFEEKIYPTYDDAYEAAENFARETYDSLLDIETEETSLANLTLSPSAIYKQNDAVAYMAGLKYYTQIIKECIHEEIINDDN